MAMTDKSGKVVWRADELPFGEEYQTEEMPERNDRRFLGRQLDKETGLVYMGARYLDPRTGRFTRPDPVSLVDPATGKVNQQMLLNPQRLNRYVYGLNNPYRYVDPDGNFAIVGAALVAAALIASNPDTANAPRSASSPTYKSHGARGMVMDSAGAIALGAAGMGISKIVGKSKGLNKAISATENFFEGEKPKILTNKSGDKIFMTKNKKIRFDIKNSHGDRPHVHFEQMKNGKWKNAFDRHRYYPKNKR